jgi:uncharacterized membrane protein YgdD (TMEM256/DUF423 family)
MDLNVPAVSLLDIVQAYQHWALLIVGALAFAGSLAFLSFLVPSIIGNAVCSRPVFTNGSE